MKAASKKKSAKTAGRGTEAAKRPTTPVRFTDHPGRQRGHRYAKIIARAWVDEEFKERLIKDPAPVFAEYGLDIPPGQSVQVVTKPPAVAQKHVIAFVLPPRPSGWTELESRPLSVSPSDDWTDGLLAKPPKPKPKPKPPCAKCWNGCC